MAEDLERTIDSFSSYFSSKGYTSVKKRSLKKPEGSDSTFPFCCAMFFEDFYSCGSDITPNKQAIEQWCIRTDNYAQAGLSPKHLTFFKMLGQFDFAPRDIGEFLDLSLSYFVGKIDPRMLVLNIPEGDTESLETIVEVAKRKDLQINRLSSGKLRWKTRIQTVLNGYRCELSYKTSRTKMELWNYSFLQTEDGSLKGIDSGGCAERLNAAVNQFDSIFEVQSIASVSTTLEGLGDVKNRAEYTSSESKGLSESELRFVTDLTRACSHCLTAGIVPGNKRNRQGQHLRNMLKVVMKQLFLADKNLDEYVATFPEVQRDSVNRDLQLFREANRFGKIKKVFQSETVATREQVKSLGSFLPKEIALDFVVDKGIVLEDFTEVPVEEAAKNYGLHILQAKRILGVV